MNDLSVHGSAWQLSLGHTPPILVEVTIGSIIWHWLTREEEFW